MLTLPSHVPYYVETDIHTGNTVMELGPRRLWEADLKQYMSVYSLGPNFSTLDALPGVHGPERSDWALRMNLHHLLSFSLFLHRACGTAHPPSRQHHSNRRWFCDPHLPLRNPWTLHPLALQSPEPVFQRQNDAVPEKQSTCDRSGQDRGCWGVSV